MGARTYAAIIALAVAVTAIVGSAEQLHDQVSEPTIAPPSSETQQLQPDVGLLVEVLNNSSVVTGLHRTAEIEQCILNVVDSANHQCGGRLLDQPVVRKRETVVDLSEVTSVYVADHFDRHVLLSFIVSSTSDHDKVYERFHHCDGRVNQAPINHGADLIVGGENYGKINDIDFDELLSYCKMTLY